MKFDKLCSILLERKDKTEKFANLVIGNTKPGFTKEDIMRDPVDVTKGTMMYLTAKDEKKQGLAAGSEQSIRRALRRLNWVTNTAIKNIERKKGGINIDKLNEYVIDLLNKYQVRVMGFEKPDKANTVYEARVIGNLLLPPTGRNPQGKSVFIIPGMDPAATIKDENKPIVTRAPAPVAAPITPRPAAAVGALDAADDFEEPVRRDVRRSTTARDLVARFEEIADFAEQVVEPDLRDAIKEIIEDAEAAEADVPETEAPEDSLREVPEGEEDEEGTGAAPENTPEVPHQESVESITEGVTARDIMRNPRIKGVFDPRAVKLALKGLINAKQIVEQPDGTLAIGSETAPGYLSGDIVRGHRTVDPEVEDKDVEELAAEFGAKEPTDGELKSIESEEGDEEAVKGKADADTPIWYPTKDAKKEDGEEEEESKVEKEPKAPKFDDEDDDAEDEVEAEPEENEDEKDDWYK